jgi:hypothetical protein
MTQAVLEKLNAIDRDLQKLKVDLILGDKLTRQRQGLYKEKEIIQSSKKMRKQLWNEVFKKYL